MLELEEEPFQKAIFFDVGSPGSMNQSNSNSKKYHIVSPYRREKIETVETDTVRDTTDDRLNL